MTTYFKLYQPCTAKEFVAFWEPFYDSGKYPEEVYMNNLGRLGELTVQNIEALWRWKSERYGSPMIPRTKEILPELNQFRRLTVVTEDDERSLWQKVFNISTGIVWQAFLFHIARPRDYAILDQHVMRAFRCLTTGRIWKDPRELTPCFSYERFCSVTKPYNSFFFELVRESGCSDPKAVDRALWAFGKHLKTLHKRDSSIPL